MFHKESKSHISVVSHCTLIAAQCVVQHRQDKLLPHHKLQSFQPCRRESIGCLKKKQKKTYTHTLGVANRFV